MKFLETHILWSWSLEKAVTNSSSPLATRPPHSSSKKKSPFTLRPPKNRRFLSTSRQHRSWIIALNGAQPVPGPTMIVGAPFAGILKEPFLTAIDTLGRSATLGSSGTLSPAR
uniref:Putative cytochrome n=1 Tax=Ixodes ricinus TaxID=34613 RepID=A0A0K8RE76_IXORI